MVKIKVKPLEIISAEEVAGDFDPPCTIQTPNLNQFPSYLPTKLHQVVKYRIGYELRLIAYTSIN